MVILYEPNPVAKQHARPASSRQREIRAEEASNVAWRNLADHAGRREGYAGLAVNYADHQAAGAVGYGSDA